FALRHTRGIPAATAIPNGLPVDTPRPIAIAVPSAILLMIRGFIRLGTASNGVERGSSLPARSSGCRNFEPDKWRPPIWCFHLRCSAQKATLGGDDRPCPSEVVSCSGGGHHSRKYREPTDLPDRRLKRSLASARVRHRQRMPRDPDIRAKLKSWQT